jgi:hypothetical protein
MSNSFLARLEDELMGTTSWPSLRQRLAVMRVIPFSIPKILRNAGGVRSVLRSVRHKLTDMRSPYEEGRAMPPSGLTMIGRARLRNIRFCIERILEDGIPGDFMEAGVWRGGAAIYMRAVLKEYAVENRTVWVADSFQGVPPPDPQYAADADALLHCWTSLAVSQKEVESHFRAYGLLDQRVRFLPGWFEDSLRTVPRITLALLRIDADLYGSTTTVLTRLYDRVANGGYVVVDDYGALQACRLAVDDFRRARRIVDPIIEIDYTGIYWIKTGTSPSQTVVTGRPGSEG